MPRVWKWALETGPNIKCLIIIKVTTILKKDCNRDLSWSSGTQLLHGPPGISIAGPRTRPAPLPLLSRPRVCRLRLPSFVFRHPFLWRVRVGSSPQLTIAIRKSYSAQTTCTGTIRKHFASSKHFPFPPRFSIFTVTFCQVSEPVHSTRFQNTPTLTSALWFSNEIFSSHGVSASAPLGSD